VLTHSEATTPRPVPRPNAAMVSRRIGHQRHGCRTWFDAFHPRPVLHGSAHRTPAAAGLAHCGTADARASALLAIPGPDREWEMEDSRARGRGIRSITAIAPPAGKSRTKGAAPDHPAACGGEVVRGPHGRRDGRRSFAGFEKRPKRRSPAANRRLPQTIRSGPAARKCFSVPEYAPRPGTGVEAAADQTIGVIWELGNLGN